MKPVKYYPQVIACPFCAELAPEGPEERTKWRDNHFPIAFATINFDDAQVLYASLICSKKADELEREGTMRDAPSVKVAEINFLVAIEADYARGEPFVVSSPVTDDPKPETIH